MVVGVLTVFFYWFLLFLSLHMIKKVLPAIDAAGNGREGARLG